MKSNFVRVVFFAGMLMCFSAGDVQALPYLLPYSTMNLLNSSITVGDTFSVQVLMDRNGLEEELTAFGFDVSTGLGSLFSYSGYIIGEEFDDFSNVDDEYNVSGFAYAGITTDTAILATLMFNSLAAGTDTIGILGIHNNLFSGAYYKDNGFNIDSSLDITINPAGTTDPVPEPATMLLLGSGLLGLACFRKRRKNS